MCNFEIRPKHIFGALVSFLLFALPSIYTYPTEKGLLAYGYLIAGSCLCFATYKAVQNPRCQPVVKLAFYLLILWSIVAAIKGIHQYEVLHIDRPKSLFKHPNVFAEHMEIIIPSVFAAILSKKNLYIRLALGVGLLLLFGGLIVTLSRGAWLAVTFAIIVMLVLEKNYKVLLLSCIPAGIAAVARYESVVERLRSIADLQMQSNAERLHVFESSITIIQNNPLTGIGFENFGNIYPSFMLPDAKELLPHAHNIILAYATEAGVLTAIAFVIFVSLLGGYAYSHYGQISNKNHRLLVLGIICGILAVLLHGFVDYTIRRSSILLVFMFLVGLGLGIISCYANSRQNKLSRI